MVNFSISIIFALFVLGSSMILLGEQILNLAKDMQFPIHTAKAGGVMLASLWAARRPTLPHASPHGPSGDPGLP